MFRLLLSKTDSLKFKRKRNWDLFVNSLFQYFMINVQQCRKQNQPQFTVHVSSYILFKPNEYKRNYVWLSFCISLLMCTVCVCVSGFLCLRDCILQLVTRPEFSHVRTQPCRRPFVLILLNHSCDVGA